MAGEKLSAACGLQPVPRLGHIAVKEAVFPFARFPGVDIILGPEMKSTGEVMGLDRDFAPRLRQVAARRRHRRAVTGTVFISVRDRDKPRDRAPSRAGWSSSASGSSPPTAPRASLRETGRRGADASTRCWRAGRTSSTLIKNGEVDLVFNTTEGAKAIDGFALAAPRGPDRQGALLHHPRRRPGGGACHCGLEGGAP